MQHIVKQISQNQAHWLSGDGFESDIILSSRVRLARNLQNFKFVNISSDQEAQEIIRLVLEASKHVSQLHDALYIEGSALEDEDLRFFQERRLISSKFCNQTNARGFLFSKNESYDLMINEEDHLRLQVLSSGYDLKSIWALINEIDQTLSEFLNFAYSEQFGYLTSCPSNVGTGIRFSVFIHLPVLAMNKQMNKIFEDAIPAGIAIRGFYGEGSKTMGNFFQISNQYTLGLSEEGILERLIPLIEHIIQKERDARDETMDKNRIHIEDKVFRAIGILSHARMLNSMECMELLSSVRLGNDLGLLEEIDQNILNELIVQTQPSHIKTIFGEKEDTINIDQMRAELVKSKLRLQSLY